MNASTRVILASGSELLVNARPDEVKTKFERASSGMVVLMDDDAQVFVVKTDLIKEISQPTGGGSPGRGRRFPGDESVSEYLGRYPGDRARRKVAEWLQHLAGST